MADIRFAPLGPRISDDRGGLPGIGTVGSGQLPNGVRRVLGPGAQGGGVYSPNDPAVMAAKRAAAQIAAQRQQQALQQHVNRLLKGSAPFVNQPADNAAENAASAVRQYGRVAPNTLIAGDRTHPRVSPGQFMQASAPAERAPILASILGGQPAGGPMNIPAPDRSAGIPDAPYVSPKMGPLPAAAALAGLEPMAAIERRMAEVSSLLRGRENRGQTGGRNVGVHTAARVARGGPSAFHTGRTGNARERVASRASRPTKGNKF